ncbi:MAG: LexA family transcriptional regulator [Salinivirgaceae bacterium]|nr:LexA family transcriptional regulator [Salinivirgaceae bacterium]
MIRLTSTTLPVVRLENFLPSSILRLLAVTLIDRYCDLGYFSTSPIAIARITGANARFVNSISVFFISLILLIDYLSQIYCNILQLSRRDAIFCNINFTMLKIKEIRESKGLSQDEIVALSGIKKRSYVDYENGKSDIPLSKLQKIASSLKVSISVLTGDSEMLLSGEEKAINELTPCVSPETNLGVPYYDVDFSGGFNAIFNNQTLLPDHNIVFAPFKDAQLWCNVTGNSMAEKINHGDIIALKELTNWEDNVLFGEIYAVVTDHIRTIKIIRKSNNEDNYKLVPINTNEFDENEVKKTSILKIFTVLGAIKKFF